MCLSSRNGDFKPTSVPIGTSIFVFPSYASLIYNCDFFPVHCGFKSVNTKHNRWSSSKVTWINLEALGGRIWTKVEKPLDYLTKNNLFYSHDFLWNKEIPIAAIWLKC